MPGFLFKNANVVLDGHVNLQPSLNVLVEHDRITAVTRDPIDPPDVTVIDVSGKTLMPGLIDAHAHITGLSLSPKNLTYPAADLVVAAANYLRNSLMAGVTTIREAGGRRGLFDCASAEARDDHRAALVLFRKGADADRRRCGFSHPDRTDGSV